MMDAANDAFAIIETDTGKVVSINNSHIRIFGYSLDELNNITLGRFYGSSSNSKIVQIFRQTASYEIFNCNVSDSSGSTLNVEVSCTPITLGGKDYILLVNKPGSEKENPFITSGLMSIEQAFKDSEAKWQSITENSPDHIMLIDTNGIILFINHTVADLSVDQVIGQSVYRFVKPEQVDLLKKNYTSVIKTGQPVQFEIDYQMEDGVVYLENRAGPVFRDGRVVALMIASRDITERKKAITQLEKSQRQLRHALQAGRTGTWEWDIQTNEVTWSDGVEAMFGMKEGSFQGSYDAFRQLVHPDDLPLIENSIENTLTKNTPYYVEHRCVFPDNSIHWLSGQGEVYRDEKGNPLQMMGTVTDITQRKEAEAALLESQQKLTMHFQKTPLGVIDWNTNLEVTEWNPAAESIFGYSREEAMGKSAFGLILNDSVREEVDSVWQSLMENQGGHKHTNENITKDGKTIICEWYNTVLVDDKGKVIGVSSLVQDITSRVSAQKELERHQQQLEELVAERTEEIREQAKIIDQIHDSVVATDLDGIVTNWNYGAERMFGYSAEESVGKNISFVYPQDQHDFLTNEIIKPLKEKGELETEVIMQRKSGDRFYALLSLSVKYDSQGVPAGLIGYSIDITDRKNAEARILQQQKALETANKELEAFSYSVSHDLRSPLRAIDGFSAAILDDYYSLLDEEGRKNFERIRNNAQRMADLIDDLLELSRVARHKFTRESVSLSLLVSDVVQKYKYVDPGRTVDVKIEDNLKVYGDPGLLRIALDNLISNAWKYTEKNKTAKIEFYQANNSDSVTFCIQDNGVGFDMRYADKLFGAFQRLHAPEEFSGNGIGLATVARIINRHGGKVWAEGAVNEGARFFFTLDEN